MTSDVTTVPGFDTLLGAYPWPSKPRFAEVAPVGRNINGYELVEEKLRATGKPNPVIMEVGAEFGASTRRDLEIPGVHVVSVDPWPDSYEFKSWPDMRAKYGGTERAMYDLFLSFNFEYRDRLVAVREFSPMGPKIVYDAGVRPDVIYLDGDHQYESIFEDLTIVSTLFPDAVIAGDDWNYNLKMKRLEGIQFPVQTSVRRWAQHHDVGIVTRRNQWLIDPAQKYNMPRVRPVFGGPAKRLAALEDKQDTLLTQQRRLLDAIENRPGRRLARKMRDAVKR